MLGLYLVDEAVTVLQFKCTVWVVTIADTMLQDK